MVASITKRKADGEFVHILERPEEFEGIAYVRLMTRNETCEQNHNCVVLGRVYVIGDAHIVAHFRR